MSKWYEVKVTNVQIFVVEVKDDGNESDAKEIAGWDAPMSGTCEYEANPLPAKGIESCKRHADIVRTLNQEGDKG